jgi:hypothetical protein
VDDGHILLGHAHLKHAAGSFTDLIWSGPDLHVGMGHDGLRVRTRSRVPSGRGNRHLGTGLAGNFDHADAICCRRLKQRSADTDHAAAAELLRQVTSEGLELAKAMSVAFKLKTTMQYGTET